MIPNAIFLVQVPADSQAIRSGFLKLRALNARTGNVEKPSKRWFVLKGNFVLYSYHKETDSQALTASPLPGYTILHGDELKGDEFVHEGDRDRVIKMFVRRSSFVSYGDGSSTLKLQNAACKKAYYFEAKTSTVAERYFLNAK